MAHISDKPPVVPVLPTDTRNRIVREDRQKPPRRRPEPPQQRRPKPDDDPHHVDEYA